MSKRKPVISTEDALRTRLRWAQERIVELEHEVRDLRGHLPGPSLEDFMAYEKAEPPPPLDAAEVEAIRARRAEAQAIEARVGEALLARIGVLINGPTRLRNDGDTRRRIEGIVREVIEAEVPPPPFKVLVDMQTDPQRVQLDFAYPVGSML